MNHRYGNLTTTFEVRTKHQSAIRSLSSRLLATKVLAPYRFARLAYVTHFVSRLLRF